MPPETSSNFSRHLVTFDTHAHIKKLISSGFEEQQAEGIIQSLLESRDYDLSQLATREQVTILERTVHNHFERTQERLEAIDKRFEEIEERFDKRFESIEKELNKFATREQLQSEIASVKYDILKWIIPMFIAIIGMMVSIFVKLH